MSRNTKCRRICAEFQHKTFTPDSNFELYVTIQPDELEALRLCDLEGMDQEQAAFRMKVSRGTFQRILYAARRKSAEALCMGKGIKIGGGNYEVADAYCECAESCKSCKRDNGEKCRHNNKCEEENEYE